MRSMARRANSAISLRTSSTPFGLLSFDDQLESKMLAAGCAKHLIAEFKTLFHFPDPNSEYAQGIFANLEANGYSSKGVQAIIEQARKDSNGRRTFDNYLENKMREAGCSRQLIAKFQKDFGNLDPQSLNAQHIYADLEARHYSPESVGRYVDSGYRFRRSTFDQPNKMQVLDLCGLRSKYKLAAVPAKIGQLSRLERLRLENNQLTTLPPEIGRLTRMKELNLNNNQLTALPPEIEQLTRMGRLDLGNNQLAALPPGIGKSIFMAELDLGNNQLTALPPEIGQLSGLITINLENNQLTELPDTLRDLKWPMHLNLSNNRFTHVPRFLLACFRLCEIDLRGNPISEEEIATVRLEMANRRAAGLAVPQIIFPRVAGDVINANNALQIAAQDGLNVHSNALTDSFKLQLDDLIKQFPDNLKGTVRKQRAEIDLIEVRLIAAFNLNYQGRDNDESHEKALKVAKTMFEKADGSTKAYYNDFQYSSGHILSYVFLAMEAQWKNTPAEYLNEAKHNGLKLLSDFLAAGNDFCDTRHIEEVMQMISLPLSQYAQKHPEVVKKVAVGLSPQQVRDTTFPVAQRTLQNMAEQKTKLSDKDLQDAFCTTLTNTMRAEHPSITAEQLDEYIRSNILDHWSEFQELVLSE
ncbi:MAG: leucine-rich repeat domain-containing protein [Burkholderiaceae bacterium]